MSASCRVLLLAVAIVGCAVVLALAEEKSQEPTVELKSIKYDELKALIRANRGKVVVVDLWYSTCVSCLKLFPDMLKMERTHAKDGLVAISLSTDATPETQAAALKYLKKQNATIANFWIDEKEAFWQDKFDTGGAPVVFVFDRQGRRAAKFDNSDTDKPAFTHEDVEKVVEQLLRAP
jgi:thiol-disulfide isomerase/thioredoxin